jgi:hypothetical protein
MNKEFKRWLEEQQKYDLDFGDNIIYNRLWEWENVPTSFFENIAQRMKDE